MKLGSLSTVANIGSDKKPKVPMETEKPATFSKDTVTGTSPLDQSGVKTTNDIEKSMSNEVIDAQHLEARGRKDRISI